MSGFSKLMISNALLSNDNAALRAELTRLRESYRDATAKGAELALRIANQAVEIDEKDRRIAELCDGSFFKRQGSTLETYRQERNEARATIAAHDAAILALRGRLEMIAADMNCADEGAGIGTCRERFPGKPEAWCPPCVAIDTLTSTAPAAQEAERRVLERAWKRADIALSHTGATLAVSHRIRAAILGTQRDASEANTNQPTNPAAELIVQGTLMTETIQSIKEATFESKFKNVYGGIEGYEITTEKQVIRLGIDMDQSCCEHTGFFMSEDNLDEFIGADLLSVEIVDDCLVPAKMEDFYEGGTMFVNLKTDRGVLQFTAYNSHNGYYGHSAVVESEQLSFETTL